MSEHPMVVRRMEIEAWAQGDPKLLSARCAKAEDALERCRRLLLDAEGTLLAYWTDVPEIDAHRLTVAIRAELGDYEPAATRVRPEGATRPS